MLQMPYRLRLWPSSSHIRGRGNLCPGSSTVGFVRTCQLTVLGFETTSLIHWALYRLRPQFRHPRSKQACSSETQFRSEPFGSSSAAEQPSACVSISQGMPRPGALPLASLLWQLLFGTVRSCSGSTHLRAWHVHLALLLISSTSIEASCSQQSK